MIGLIVSFAFALVSGQVTQIPATQISGDVFQGGDYPVVAVQWDGPSIAPWPCGEDACWLIITNQGYVDWNHGEVKLAR